MWTCSGYSALPGSLVPSLRLSHPHPGAQVVGAFAQFHVLSLTWSQTHYRPRSSPQLSWDHLSTPILKPPSLKFSLKLEPSPIVVKRPPIISFLITYFSFCDFQLKRPANQLAKNETSTTCKLNLNHLFAELYLTSSHFMSHHYIRKKTHPLYKHVKCQQ